MLSKKCIGKCRLDKPITDFYKKDTNKDGRSNECIECEKERKKERSARSRRNKNEFFLCN